jgi:hypothetical protein
MQQGYLLSGHKILEYPVYFAQCMCHAPAQGRPGGAEDDAAPPFWFPFGLDLAIFGPARLTQPPPGGGANRALQVLRAGPPQLRLLSLVGFNISVADAIIHNVPFQLS